MGAPVMVMLLISVLAYLAVLGFAYALCSAARRGDTLNVRLDERTLAFLLSRTLSASDEAVDPMMSEAGLSSWRGSLQPTPANEILSAARGDAPARTGVAKIIGLANRRVRSR